MKNQSNQSNDNLIIKAKDAIEHIDRNVADDILRKIVKGDVIDSRVLDLKRHLQIVNFPNISDQEASNIFKNNILDFFRIEISIKDSVESRYVIQGQYEKNNQRKILKKAILQNNERLGLYTIGQWIQEFDQEYKIKKMKELDIVNFILNNADAQKLTDSQKAILKKILYTYDTILVDQVVDIFDLVEIKERLKKGGIISNKNNQEDEFRDFYKNEQARNNTIKNNQNMEHLNKIVRNIKLSFSKAIEKYPKIGEQVISGNNINIEGQSYSVKGSIENWIKDYYTVVGAGNRDVMKRSSYLYHSQNTKNLSAEEKQKLSLIIKSLEDDASVIINTTEEKIIFPTNGNIDISKKSTEKKKEEQEQEEVINRNKINHKRKKEIVFDREKSEKKVANEIYSGKINHIKGNGFNLKSDHFKTNEKDNNMEFSTPQQLPIEKKLNKNNNFRRIKPVNLKLG